MDNLYVKFPRKVDMEHIDGDAYVKAVEVLRTLFPHFKEGWINVCTKRLSDVEYIGTRRGEDIFKVVRNPKLDGMPDGTRKNSWTYRKVILKEHSHNHFCSCFFGLYFQKRRRHLCSHIGACLLFRYYFQLLEGRR